MAQEAQVQGGPAGARDPPAMLAGFVRYLEESGFLEFRVEGDGSGRGAGEEAARNGIKLHALVMLADRFGLGSPYGCDMYMYGPVSRLLAEDVRALSRGRARLYDGVRAAVPGALRRREFESLVRGRDADWLSGASMLAAMRPHRSTRDGLLDTIRDDDLVGREPTYTGEYASEILGKLEAAGLVTPYP